MAESFAPGALLARFYPLPRGPRVRLRLARIGDTAGIEALLARRGAALDAVDLARLVRSDPRERVVICATALIGSRETIVGLGAIDVEDAGVAAPKLLVVDDQITDGLDELLAGALESRAQALARAA